MMEICSRTEHFLSLAITEAFAGSDVAGLRTYAQKTEDGKHWIINGEPSVLSLFSAGLMSFDYFRNVCNSILRFLSMITEHPL